MLVNINYINDRQRQRAASSSDAMGTRPQEGQQGPASSTRYRTTSHQQYSLFGHYWDAFLNSDTSTDEDERDGSDDSSTGSDLNGRPYDRRRHNHRRHHRSNGSFPTHSNSPPRRNGSTAAVSTNPVTQSMALSRSSDRRRLRALIAAQSLPFSLLSVADFKCPICHKTVPSNDIELHLAVCLTKPRISYNGIFILLLFQL